MARLVSQLNGDVLAISASCLAGVSAGACAHAVTLNGRAQSQSFSRLNVVHWCHAHGVPLPLPDHFDVDARLSGLDRAAEQHRVLLSEEPGWSKGLFAPFTGEVLQYAVPCACASAGSACAHNVRVNFISERQPWSWRAILLWCERKSACPPVHPPCLYS